MVSVVSVRYRGQGITCVHCLHVYTQGCRDTCRSQGQQSRKSGEGRPRGPPKDPRSLESYSRGVPWVGKARVPPGARHSTRVLILIFFMPR